MIWEYFQRGYRHQAPAPPPWIPSGEVAEQEGETTVNIWKQKQEENYEGLTVSSRHFPACLIITVKRWSRDIHQAY